MVDCTVGLSISIHALREEGDVNVHGSYCVVRIFLSTPSARRATKPVVDEKPVVDISIHALREEGDATRQLLAIAYNYFYPRPPRGGRPLTKRAGFYIIQFLSTPSARRATCMPWQIWRCSDISIHALREEGDDAAAGLQCSSAHFYPRPPRGGRQARAVASLIRKEFLSTPSARRATLTRCRCRSATCISIHALREEGDSALSSPAAYRLNFYPRPPRGGRPPVSTTRSWI